jgi:hypothetical protein
MKQGTSSMGTGDNLIHRATYVIRIFSVWGKQCEQKEMAVCFSICPLSPVTSTASIQPYTPCMEIILKVTSRLRVPLRGLQNCSGSNTDMSTTFATYKRGNFWCCSKHFEVLLRQISQLWH